MICWRRVGICSGSSGSSAAEAWMRLHTRPALARYASIPIDAYSSLFKKRNEDVRFIWSGRECSMYPETDLVASTRRSVALKASFNLALTPFHMMCHHTSPPSESTPLYFPSTILDKPFSSQLALTHRRTWGQSPRRRLSLLCLREMFLCGKRM